MIFYLFTQPAANSSGIPFVKAYLNGASIPQAFNLKTLFTKMIGVVSCVSTSLPVGPEGVNKDTTIRTNTLYSLYRRPSI